MCNFNFFLVPSNSVASSIISPPLTEISIYTTLTSYIICAIATGIWNKSQVMPHIS